MGAAPPLRVLDLFSGIGGFSLGLERSGGFKAVAFCEIEDFCRRVLAKNWPGVHCYEDVRNLTSDRLRADGISVDVVCGGFPCQNISNAGRREGLGGSKSGLWSEMRRLIAELRPELAIIENSAHGARHWVWSVIADLEALDMVATPIGIAASDLGANHERRRVYILADACGRRHRMAKEALRAGRPGSQLHSWWAAEPAVRRVDDGVPNRVDRIAALGNAIVPQIPEVIGRAILSAAGRRAPSRGEQNV